MQNTEINLKELKVFDNKNRRFLHYLLGIFRHKKLYFNKTSNKVTQFLVILAIFSVRTVDPRNLFNLIATGGY